jgi:hypothetical protein
MQNILIDYFVFIQCYINNFTSLKYNMIFNVISNLSKVIKFTLKFVFKIINPISIQRKSSNSL